MVRNKYRYGKTNVIADRIQRGIADMIRKCFQYVLTFFVIISLLMGMLVLSARIPRALIRENIKESAVYLCKGELFGTLVEGVNGSRIDRYADSILLAIAYQYDSDKPLSSVMWSSYYYTELCNENENLLSAVTNDYEANQQYLRYWHGSNALVRPLLTVFNLQQIYALNGIVLTLLTFLLLAVLLREKAYIPAVGVVLGFVLTSAWFVPFSLEYTWTYLLMLLLSVVGVRLVSQKRYQAVGLFFLISGMVTNYFDFLTTETLTLTVPLLLMMWMRRRQREQCKREECNTDDGKGCKEYLFAGKAACAWIVGYAGMWAMKWLIASVVLSENVTPYVTQHIGERLGGELGIGSFAYIFGSLWRNVKCLFPFEYGEIGTLAGIALIVFAVYLGYVYHGKHVDKKHISLYVLIGLIPYFRFVILHNHSYLHCFFTYRAQMATVLAIVMILERVTEGMLPACAKGRRL